MREGDTTSCTYPLPCDARHWSLQLQFVDYTYKWTTIRHWLYTYFPSKFVNCTKWYGNKQWLLFLFIYFFDFLNFISYSCFGPALYAYSVASEITELFVFRVCYHLTVTWPDLLLKPVTGDKCLYKAWINDLFNL